jgi:hypothetical protein
MIKFIKTIIVFTLPLFLGCFIMEGMLRNIPNDYALKRKYLDKNAASIETLVLGSSHTFYGVNPAFLSAKAYNLAFLSQSLDYDWELLNKYQGDLKNLKTIIIPISYFSLFSKLEGGPEAWRQNYYYRFFDLKSSTPFKYRFEVTSLKVKRNFSRIRSYYINKKSPILSNDQGMASSKMKSRLDFKKDGIEAALRHAGIIDFKDLDENIEILKTIISYAGSHDLQVVFVTTPTTSYYYDRLDVVQLETVKKTMQSLDSINVHVQYYDFLKDKRFNESDFRDADHLNEKGAEKFTKLLDNLVSN